MRAITALVTVVVFLTLEWAAAASGVVLLSALPLASFGVLWWLNRMPLVSRMIFASASGFLLDVSGAHPFGASLMLFVFLAVGVEFLQTIFSAHDSRAARGVSMIVILTLFFLLRPVCYSIVTLLS